MSGIITELDLCAVRYQMPGNDSYIFSYMCQQISNTSHQNRVTNSLVGYLGQNNSFVYRDKNYFR